MKGSVEELPQKVRESMIGKKIWSEECPVSLDDLRLVKIEHCDFFSQVKNGELVVYKSKAQDALEIFAKLFEIKFQIHQAKLIDEYNGDDEASMADNNSSCFNFRKIAGSDKISIHGYGLAIDINPVQNPAIVMGEKSMAVSIHPKKGIDFLNRTNDRSGMVESVVEIFKTHGFTVWGGNWNTPIDYQHFQVDRSFIEVMDKATV